MTGRFDPCSVGLISEPRRRKSPFSVLIETYRTHSTFQFCLDFAVLGWLTVACVSLSEGGVVSLPSLSSLFPSAQSAKNEPAPAPAPTSATMAASSTPSPNEASKQALSGLTRSQIVERIFTGQGQKIAAPNPNDYVLDPAVFLTVRPADRARKLQAAFYLYTQHAPIETVRAILSELDPSEPPVQYVLALTDLATSGRSSAEAGLARMKSAAEAGFVPAMVALGIAGFTPPALLPPDAALGRRWLQEASDHGDGQAAYILGVAYSSGWAGITDPVKSAVLFRRSHELGFSRGSMAYGLALIQGVGVAKDATAAEEVLHVAAERGSHNGEVEYAYGNVLTMIAVSGWASYDEAIKWLNRSAEKGSAHALMTLGGIRSFMADREPYKNPTEGFRLFQKCADAGLAGCYLAMGNSAYNGIGTPRDMARTYAFLTYANELAPEGTAKRVLEKVAPEFTADDMRAGEVILSTLRARRGRP